MANGDHPAARASALGYVRGLDGVRGVALIMVLLIHGSVDLLHGGFFAVDVFFVLSGFLITSLLLEELRKSGRISLGDFWVRRLLRLLPALLVVVGAIYIFARLTFPAALQERTTTELVDTITYRSNWAIADQGRPTLSMMRQSWSLAVEMQFYLLWPLIVLVLLWAIQRFRPEARFEARVRVVTVAALLLALAGAGIRAAETLAGYSWWRTYLGTDCRIDALLLGCALSGIVILGGLRRWQPWFGIVGLAVLVALVTLGHLEDPWVPLWGSAVVALAAAVVIGDVVNRGPTAWVLAIAPFVYLGKVSYGAYLWHWPIYMAINGGWLHVPDWLLLTIRIAVSLALASLSWYVIERPALRLKRRFERTDTGRAAVAAESGAVDLRGRPAPEPTAAETATQAQRPA